MVGGRTWTDDTGLAGTERNRKAADAIESEAWKAVKLGKGKILKVESVSFSDAAEKFLQWVEAKHAKKPNTIRRCKGSFASLTGNSDGTDPFVAGVIEDNLVQDTTGYDMEIKFQLPRPPVPGMPTEASSTIIRNNVFIKGDQPSPDGDRPNVLVGAFPDSGPGSNDLYQFYGNFFDHNPREALLQASGRVVIHDNIFVDGQYAAVVVRDQDLPLKLAYLYNNTVYTLQQGIFFGNAAQTADAVMGNLVFADTPISGPIKHESKNLTDTVANASNYVNSPSFVLGVMNFYPLPGRSRGAAAGPLSICLERGL
jgi:hypothetical protein